MIRGTNLTVRLGGRVILDGVDCTVRPGRVTVVMGKNGAGKSTLLNRLASRNSEGAVAGAVEVDGRCLSVYDPKELGRKRAVLAQSVHLGFPLSVAEVVEIGCYGRYDALTTRQRRERVRHYLDLLELTDLRDRSYPTLSGGEQKRVLLAKCLLQLDHDGTDQKTNHYLLLDEPTAALDVEQQYRFVHLATGLARERGMGVFAVLHDLNLAARFADDLIFLKGGKLVAAGPKASVLTKTIIRTTFDVDCLIQAHPRADCPLITTLPYEQPNLAPACAPQRT
ncbi:heme ABC transporter ATP-binding protein [Neolewinella antarctica]|uniref:Iron complex transport system ATP-binding protein n=1 Tax=Neolewinella antarctica TaxID=442734 RepID=A0ABX0XBZ3_9BACT|nr:heme ABC transporter ATP-binding protein [Neolewinella antarctica]NJC26769.1 iron complex transport system ATP-binding protein [Neolewinella antarctica]